MVLAWQLSSSGVVPKNRSGGRWYRLSQGDRDLPQDHEWGHRWEPEGQIKNK